MDNLVNVLFTFEADPAGMDQKFSETLASIVALKAGVRVSESYGSGPWFDVSERTLRRLQHDTLAEKRWQLELYKSGQVAFHSNPAPGVQVDTTAEIIASLEADIALVESTL